MKKLIVAGVFLALMGPMAASSRGNFILNGSFETGDFTNWTQVGGATGVALTGGPGGYAPEDGNYYAYLGTVGGLGTLSQSFATTVGQSYILTYYLASNGTTPNEFRTDINGTTYFDQVNIPTQAYTLYTYTFTATGTSSTLEFFERNDPNYLALDNVAVNLAPTSVPEPSTLILSTLGGLVILGGRKLKLRRSRS